MVIDISYYERCIDTLAKAHKLLLQTDPDIIDYDMYRSACVKEFEIILEQSGKLLRKVIKPYYHSGIQVDRMYFKDIFREAVVRGIISPEMAERWLTYRDNRNNTAHDYGVNFAEETLSLLPQFILDATELAIIIKKENDAA
jgi:nucleotidyltransferase substrate binding protein (TIGR01987 family)